jgi:hypothetical protein
MQVNTSMGNADGVTSSREHFPRRSRRAFDE